MQIFFIEMGEATQFAKAVAGGCKRSDSFLLFHILLFFPSSSSSSFTADTIYNESCVLPCKGLH